MSGTGEEMTVERIRQARPLAQEAPLARERLRRELLSQHASDRKRWARWRSVFLATTALVLGALGLLTLISLLPQRMSAQEMLQGLEKRYRQGAVPASTHYIRSEMSVSSNPGPPLCVETWTAGGGRIRVRASRGGTTLAHILLTGSGRYTLPGKSAIDLNLELRPASSQARGSRKSFRQVWFYPGEQPAGKKGSAAQGRMIVARGEMAPLAFARQLPADLYRRLEKSPGLERIAAKSPRGNGQALEVFRRRSTSDLRCYTVEYDPSNRGGIVGLAGRLASGAEDPGSVSSGSVRLPRFPPGRPFITGKMDIEERVAIFRKSGRVAHVEFVSTWKDGPNERYRLEFLEDSFPGFKSSDYDPAVLGLVKTEK